MQRITDLPDDLQWLIWREYYQYCMAELQDIVMIRTLKNELIRLISAHYYMHAACSYL